MCEYSPPNLGGWKKFVDIGRTVSKPIKLTVSGKNSPILENHSIQTLKFEQKLSDAVVSTMNHMIKRDDLNNDIEEIDTHEG